MLEKLLEEIVISVVGKSAQGIVELLNTPKYVNEFVIAKKLDITINQTRNILYKISDYGLVSSVRKKDKKKGWYTYYWKFEILKCLEFLKEHLEKNKKEIQDEIKLRETKVFYVCKSDDLEFDEDQALLMNFTCDECGEVFTVRDSSKIVKELGKALSKIDEKIKIVDDELQKENSKLEKKRELDARKEERVKKKEAEKKRKARMKEAAKKKSVKKVSGKKVSAKKKPTQKKKSVKKTSVKKKSSKKKPATKKKVSKKSSGKKKRR